MQYRAARHENDRQEQTHRQRVAPAPAPEAPAKALRPCADGFAREKAPQVLREVCGGRVAPGRVLPQTGQADPFERRALEWLESNNGWPELRFREYHEINEKDGERWLWYARPRLMEKSCLSCHNDPKGRSPKQDWQVGDVGGVIKIGRRLATPTVSRPGMGAALALMTASGVALAAFVLVTFRRRRQAGPR